MERFRRGDREAFAELVVRYQGPVYNAAFWVVRRAEDASDICQTAFLKVAERIDDYDPRFKFFSWLYRIALNEALNLVRDRGREEELDEAMDLPAPGADGPEERLQAAQRSGRIQEALMKLSTRDRVVVSLRHFSELSYAEIAEVLDLDEKTVKSRLFEARQRLRVLLGDLKELACAPLNCSADALRARRRGDAGRGGRARTPAGGQPGRRAPSSSSSGTFSTISPRVPRQASAGGSRRIGPAAALPVIPQPGERAVQLSPAFRVLAGQPGGHRHARRQPPETTTSTRVRRKETSR